jgi:glucosamine-6-phosphate deaminase
MLPHPQKTLQIDALSIRLHNNETELALDAEQLARNCLQSVLAKKGSAAIILATGNSQIKFLEYLVESQGIDWSKVTIFHLDEFLGIDAEHPGSFRRYLQERVENKVKSFQFHYIVGDTLQPLDECLRYTQLLQAQTIDLCCLGVGENGHLAFNEPSVVNFNDPHSVKLVKLDESTRISQLNSGYFTTLEEIPKYAITLTIPMICAAQKIFCLAPGKRKEPVVKTMLQEAISEGFPASILRKQAHATLFLDADSASFLQ